MISVVDISTRNILHLPIASGILRQSPHSGFGPWWPCRNSGTSFVGAHCQTLQNLRLSWRRQVFIVLEGPRCVQSFTSKMGSKILPWVLCVPFFEWFIYFGIALSYPSGITDEKSQMVFFWNSGHTSGLGRTLLTLRVENVPLGCNATVFYGTILLRFWRFACTSSWVHLTT